MDHSPSDLPVRPSSPRRLGVISVAPRVMLETDAGPGGTRTQLLGLMGGFRSLGWAIETYFAGDKLPKKVGRRAVRTERVGRFGALGVDVVRLGMVQFHRRRVWRELGGRVDWVYEQFNTLGAIGQVFQRRGIPWIIATDALQYQEAKARNMLALERLAKRIERTAYHQCDAVAVISDALKDLLVRELNVPAEKIIVRPNGVDTDQFDPKRYTPVRRHDAFTVGFVGSLYAWQGIDLLLRAVHALRTSGRDIRVTIVGSGSAEADFRALATSLGLADVVVFAGRVDWKDVPPYIAGFDLGYDGHVPTDAGQIYMSPLKLYEYCAMATPPVAAITPDAQRLIEAVASEMLFRVGDIEDLQRALAWAYDHRDELPALGRTYRELVIAHHSWQARVSALIEQVETVTTRSRARRR